MVVKDVGLPKLHQGVVPLLGEIDKDIELYLNQSEQTPSFVSVGALLDEEGSLAISGGVLLQSLPEPQTSVIHDLVERMQELPPVVNMLQDGDTPEKVLDKIFAGIPYTKLETRPLVFQCKCGWERSEGALLSLGVDDLESLIEDGEAIIDCHFCHQQYRFDREDLEKILEKVKERGS
jgi:molecular chaperone Hsp33